MDHPVLIKIGGALIGDPVRLQRLWHAVKRLQAAGPVMVVHGGGPQATALARLLGHEPTIVQGRRVTTDLDLDVVKWTLRGSVNADLVSGAVAAGLRAVGLGGLDGFTVRAVRRPHLTIDGVEVDFGHVGDVRAVDPELLLYLARGGFLPIMCPLSADAEGNLYNINADTVACAVASSVGAGRFLLVTETGGVRRDPSDASTLLTSCSEEAFAAGVAEGWISGGMQVKLNVAFKALKAGIPEVQVLAPDDLDSGAGGTLITNS